MAGETRSMIVSEVLIEFLDNLGNQKNGQLRNKLLFSVELLKSINRQFETEESFFAVIPYSTEKENWRSLLNGINRIKFDESDRSPSSYDRVFLLSMFIAQELVLGISGYKLQKIEDFWDINYVVDEVLSNKFKNEILEVSTDTIGMLEFFQNRRVFEIINYNLQNADFQEFLNYQKNKSQLNQDIESQFQGLDVKKSEISTLITTEAIKANALVDYLKGIQSDYNFVGLSKGFQDLLAKKKCSKWILFAGLVIMGIVIILPIYCRIQEGQWTNIVWQEIAFSISLELILIYFFRIILGEYNSIKTQIMQLELRVSLCRFIESYADYVKKINENNSDKNILEKFEGVIFSNILADSKDMPSTFDGIEQIGNLIKTLKDK